MPQYTLADILAPREKAPAYETARPALPMMPGLPQLPIPGEVAAPAQPGGFTGWGGDMDVPALGPNPFGPDGRPSAALLEAVRLVESGGNDRAVSPRGAQGPFQIMPATARSPGFGVAPINPADVWDRTRARDWAADYLAAMYRRYSSPMLAVAAYNAGPGTIDKALQRGGFSAFPAETQQYVQRVGVY